MSEKPSFGLLNINKPAGMTSRRVVDHVVPLVKPAKAGHAGTLDPMATGVLVVCVGRATRLISYVQSSEKVYQAKFVLGCRSNTDDITGEVTPVPDAPNVAHEQIENLIPQFVGTIQQVPPQFSAVHIDGKRAYKLARQGKSVELSAREVTVHSMEILNFTFPDLELEITCGSGTYIRSIGRDLGNQLGCGAVMSGLIRTRIGSFEIADAVDLKDLDPQSLTSHLQPAQRAVARFTQYRCSPAEISDISFGRTIQISHSTDSPSPPIDGDTLALLTPDGDLAALAGFRAQDGTLAPKDVFVQAISKP